MVRAVGSDPGTSSLDLLLLDDGAVIDQRRFQPGELAGDPELLSRLFATWAPIDLAAAPSGYGLPLVSGACFTEDSLEQMSLVRPADRGRDSGVIGFCAWVRVYQDTGADCVPARRAASSDDSTASKGEFD